MVDEVSPALAIRSNVGIEVWSSAKYGSPYEHSANLPREETKNSRSVSFSSDGRYFAYTNGLEVTILKTEDWQLQCSLPRPKTFYIEFSPRGNFICTWELYTVSKDKLEGPPNMFVYDVATGKEMFSVIQKNQTYWKPSWSTDESIFAIVVGGEALFYNLGEGGFGFEVPGRKIGGSRGCVLSLGPGNSPPFLAFYTPGNKNSPSMCKLYKYPALNQNQTVACKSFFQADRVEMLWNKRGTGLLLLTSTEVDKSGASYYGNQALHFMYVKGDSCSVPLSKEGPVHCVKWSPRATEFIVVYGLMPSKAAMYNLKCDVIFDFGEGPRNCAYFNNFGNLVVLAGFGNLPGNIEIWDMNKREKLSCIKVPDTTYFEWNPNGEYFITATTAPRLRIGNGFKVYHYSGALMHETIWPPGQELLEVKWQEFPENFFDEPPITKIKHEGIKSSQPEASKKVYTPPHLRLMKEGKDPEQYLPQPKISLCKNSAGSASKANVSQKNVGNTKAINQKTNFKIKNCRKENDKTFNEIGGQSSLTEYHSDSQKYVNSTRQPASKRKPIKKIEITSAFENDADEEIQKSTDTFKTVNNTTHISKQDFFSQISEPAKEKSSNQEKEKKIRNVAKKLSDIKKLKARQDQGETLELNQLKKISQEAKFLEELKSLKMSA